MDNKKVIDKVNYSVEHTTLVTYNKSGKPTEISDLDKLMLAPRD